MKLIIIISLMILSTGVMACDIKTGCLPGTLTQVPKEFTGKTQEDARLSLLWILKQKMAICPVKKRIKI